MIGRVLALAIGLLAGLAASQGPEFAQQYRQRLGGRLDELGRRVTRFDQGAQASGLTRENAITQLQSGPDPLVKRQGEAAEADVDRLARLQRQRAAFEDAGPFGQTLALLRGIDGELADATYQEYRPAWPATSEGLATGGAGFVLGWGGLLYLRRLLVRLRPGRRASAGARAV